jgi:hypothetical protein
MHVAMGVGQPAAGHRRQRVGKEQIGIWCSQKGKIGASRLTQPLGTSTGHPAGLRS